MSFYCPIRQITMEIYETEVNIMNSDKNTEIINDFSGEYRFLSNFYQYDFEFKGLTYHNSEAAFQAQKCASEEEKIRLV